MSLSMRAAPSRGVVGQTYTRGYVNWTVGNSPVILLAQHGGTSEPGSIPDRTSGDCGGSDFGLSPDPNTIELTNTIAAQVTASYPGRIPHVVRTTLRRNKLDMNRPIAEGACNSLEARSVWQTFHGRVERMIALVGGPCMVLDVHGYGGSNVALSYGLTRAQVTDDPASYATVSTLQHLLYRTSTSFATLVRALGTSLEAGEVAARPSTENPNPDSGYFSGAMPYYGSAHYGMNIPSCGAILIEHPSAIRTSTESREAYAAVFVPAVQAFLSHFGMQW